MRETAEGPCVCEQFLYLAIIVDMDLSHHHCNQELVRYVGNTAEEASIFNGLENSDVLLFSAHVLHEMPSRSVDAYWQ
ncbi:MAG: hypothetical protein EON58_10955 [Alphaproteobacteria bacterium]|nr:MAG: hypothetical protein EON58_10955 [Alphaproteobacteria bacterium]